MSVMIVTSLGDIVMDLYTDRCPLTCKNFLKLCKIKYYNGCLFHTVQKDFTAQTGDPTGTGSGGDAIYKFLYGDQARFFGDEIHLDIKHTKTGTVAMASAGENLNASQFYITLRDDLEYLDGKHTVFGEVAEGLDTLTRINEAYVDAKSRPYKNIRIKHTYILDDPFEDPPQLAELIPDASPEGKPKDEIDDDVRLEDDWVPMDEQLGQQELEEALRSKAAHSSAVVLESIGDIPDAEMKPPENVLFVCKLNPVTEDEDLHTIFSRFGTVTSAEVIRDYKTGDSLCYAFIEFEDKAACEQAYFKMDNALIDDRRIHVDFSQSVAKLWSQYRRKGQAGKGGGCFKCGSLDHIAKDCTGESTIGQPNSKYTLKDDNTQRGGDDNTRFEMVFDEDTPGSPRRTKTRRDHNAENDDQKEHVKRWNSNDHKDQDGRRRDSHDDRRGRSKSYKEDERPVRRRMSPYGERDREEYRKRHTGDTSYKGEKRDYEKPRGDASHGYKRDEREYDEREHKERRGDMGHRDRNSGRDSKKRNTDDDLQERRVEERFVDAKGSKDASHRYKRDEREYKERRMDIGRGVRDSGRGDSKKRSADDALRERDQDEARYDRSRREKRRGEEWFADTRGSKDDRDGGGRS